MCIICNTDHEHTHLADIFLGHFQLASKSMKLAEKTLLELAPHTVKKEQYLKLHKELVRVRRAWNTLEQKRELDSTPPTTNTVADTPEHPEHSLKGCQCPKGSDIRFCLGVNSPPITNERKNEI